MSVRYEMLITVPMLLIVGFATCAWAQERAWEREWNLILSAAKKEGKVVVMGSPDADVRRELPAKFRERFGIGLEYLGGRGGDNAAKLVMERRAGISTVDVIFASLETLGRELYLEKILDPLRPVLILPEVVTASKWKGGKLWFMDPEEKYILRLYNYVSGGGLSINTRHVKPEEFRSIKELLNPKWKGKISVHDPTVRMGESFRLSRQFGEDFVKKLYVDQKPAISRDKRQIADWLAQGTYPVSWGVETETVIDMRKLGLPVELLEVPDAPGAISAGNGSMAFLSKAPHPNAARLFVNWIASKEGLEILGRTRNKPTTRVDIDESYAPHWEIPRPGVHYFDDHAWEMIYESPKWREKMKELLRHGNWR